MSGPVPIKYISDKQIEEISSRLLHEFGVFDTVPVPVERIIELKLELNVVPFPNLYRDFEINSFITGDLSSIYIDEHLQINLPYQRNFTLAHELGHLFLHDYVYKEHQFSKIDGYKKFMNNFSPVEYSLFESQANEFAGRFLVPDHQLEFHFAREKKGIDGLINRLGNRAQKIEIISLVMSDRLSPIFEAHKVPIKIRIKKTGLVIKHFNL